MQEVSIFIKTSLSSLPHTSLDDAKKVADTYQGLAEVFQRVASDVRARVSASKGYEAEESEREVGVLLNFAQKGKAAVAQVQGKRA